MYFKIKYKALIKYVCIYVYDMKKIWNLDNTIIFKRQK